MCLADLTAEYNNKTVKGKESANCAGLVHICFHHLLSYSVVVHPTEYISTILLPESWAHPCPTQQASDISTRDFLFKDSVKEPVSMYCTSALRFCYEEEFMVNDRHCSQRCSLFPYFKDSKKLGVFRGSLFKDKSTLKNNGFKFHKSQCF